MKRSGHGNYVNGGVTKTGDKSAPCVVFSPKMSFKSNLIQIKTC